VTSDTTAGLYAPDGAAAVCPQAASSVFVIRIALSAADLMMPFFPVLFTHVLLNSFDTHHDTTTKNRGQRKRLDSRSFLS
jgi:hypothetical protein